MRKFKLKTPIVDIPDAKKKNILSTELETIKRAFNTQINSSETTEDTLSYVNSTESSKIIGGFTVFFYFLTFIWIYGSSWFNYDITMSLKDKKGFTMSEAFEHSEKIGSTTLLVILFSMIIGLQINQGFIENSQSVSYSDLRYSLVMVSFVLLASMLLLFWIPISKNKIQMSVHGFVAILILFFGLFSSYVFYTSYKEFIDSEIVDVIEYLTYTMGILIVVIVFALAAGSFRKIFKKTGDTIVAGAEIIYILVYGVVICLFTQLPSISALNFDKICYS